MSAQPVSIEGLSPEAAAAVVKLSRGLANSSDMNDRVTFYNLAKKADPNVSIPVDVQMEQFRREQKQNEETKEIERKASEHRTRQEKQKRELIESGRYSEEVVKRMEDEIMTPQGISDYGIAAKLFAAENPDPTPNIPDRTATGATWTMPWMAEGQDKAKVSQMIANPRKAALEKAHAHVTELRQKRRA